MFSGEMWAGEVQVDGKHGHADRAKRHQADLDLVPGQALAEQRADANADREQGQGQIQYAFAATEEGLRVGRQLRGEHGAEKPEPGDAEDRVEDRAVLGHEAHDAQRFADRVPVEFQIRCAGGCGWYCAADQISEYGDADDKDRSGRSTEITECHQRTADHHADQHRHRGAHFNQAIAADEFFCLEGLRQDRVLDRTKYGRVQPHQEQHDKQQPDLVRVEGVHGNQHRADLEQFDVADQARLLEFLRDLSGAG